MRVESSQTVMRAWGAVEVGGVAAKEGAAVPGGVTTVGAGNLAMPAQETSSAARENNQRGKILFKRDGKEGTLWALQIVWQRGYDNFAS